MRISPRRVCYKLLPRHIASCQLVPSVFPLVSTGLQQFLRLFCLCLVVFEAAVIFCRMLKCETMTMMSDHAILSECPAADLLPDFAQR